MSEIRVDNIWKFVTRNTEKCPLSLLTGVGMKRFNFRENIWAFRWHKWNCPLYTGVRRAGFHCKSSLERARVYSFCYVCCAHAVLFVENVTDLGLLFCVLYCTAVLDGLLQQVNDINSKNYKITLPKSHCSCRQLLNLLDWDNISINIIRRAKQKAKLTYKCTNNLAPPVICLPWESQ